MVNFIERVLTHPEYSRQFNCGDSLITVFNCPLEARLMKNRFTDLWSQNNYVFYVIDGRKVWHTANGSYDLQKGSCVFIQKGASIIEQFFDIGFCLILFFIPDGFICETLKSKTIPASKGVRKYDPVIMLNSSETLAAFFVSMSSYFANTKEPDPLLLELKFRELILTLADNPLNAELLSYFCSLMNEPQSLCMQRVMNDNYCFNLTLEQYAVLCNRSLSAFKRDFKKLYHTTPGKWLHEKRLNHAMHLLTNLNKTVSEAAFASGFENPSHFSRAFKARFGKHPTAIKKLPAA
ncbi:helix-turn-helix transcriptional regulator [Ginsengibacter hankyongi]|uniref:Helix-turn-helix transcriptional regulator n=1 Tax=Ginsengibacter hankyongi TaxID=2607284 RepID=A0A5J5IEE5_9BACT|nr:AraC family transcriptional regulator [Ginsengibacter hankyongi]KAA9038368.1 helix-turn-helix transcriptional regulator [Ginsengibacter hankyongi]